MNHYQVTLFKGANTQIVSRIMQARNISEAKSEFNRDGEIKSITQPGNWTGVKKLRRY